MRIRRDNLFWGLVFVGLGAIPLLVRAGAIESSIFVDVGRWWPVALIAIGVLLVLGRSRAAVVGVAVAGLTIGILGGGMLASGSGVIGGLADCGNVVGDSRPGQVADERGTFTGDAETVLELACGTVEADVAPGSDWRVVAYHEGEPPRIEADATSLRVTGQDGFGVTEQDWRVTLPADQLRDLRLRSNAGTGELRLAGAALTGLDAEINAGDLRIDATGATIDEIAASVNAGRIRITLGDGSVGGELSVNAGSIELCVPPGSALVLRVEDQVTFGHNLDERGLARDGDTWTRPGTAGSTIDLRIEGNAASLTLDPDGGC